jgi:hypothetical protein
VGRKTVIETERERQFWGAGVKVDGNIENPTGINTYVFKNEKTGTIGSRVFIGVFGHVHCFAKTAIIDSGFQQVIQTW